MENLDESNATLIWESTFAYWATHASFALPFLGLCFLW